MDLLVDVPSATFLGRLTQAPYLSFNFPKVESFSGFWTCFVLVFGGGVVMAFPFLLPPLQKVIKIC